MSLKKIEPSIPAFDFDLGAEMEGAFSAKLDRLRKARKFQQLQIIDALAATGEHDDVVSKIHDCSTYLRYRIYPAIKQHRLVGANFCKTRTLCIPCEIRRGSNYVARYSQKFTFLHEEYPKLKPYFITLTIKNTDCPSVGHRHLTNSFNKLTQRARSYARNRGSYTEWSKVKAFVSSQEFTRNQTTKQWHPHLHICVLASSEIDQAHLAAEWKNITKDSHVLDVRPFDNDNLIKSFCEVFKYSVKPSGLSATDLVEVTKAMKGKHLIRAGGLFLGVVVDDHACDEISDLEGERYIELVFRWSVNTNSYYIHDGYDSADYPTE